MNANPTHITILILAVVLSLFSLNFYHIYIFYTTVMLLDLFPGRFILILYI